MAKIKFLRRKRMLNDEEKRLLENIYGILHMKNFDIIADKINGNEVESFDMYHKYEPDKDRDNLNRRELAIQRREQQLNIDEQKIKLLTNSACRMIADSKYYDKLFRRICMAFFVFQVLMLTLGIYSNFWS